jgi:hypothetical protein
LSRLDPKILSLIDGFLVNFVQLASVDEDQTLA